MPLANRFRHQAYTAQAPTSPHHLVAPPSCPSVESAEFRRRLAEVGRQYRRAGVSAIYLVHGTFVGADALGLLNELGRIYPAAEKLLNTLAKQAVDAIACDAGNYTGQFARLFEEGLGAPGEPTIPVRRFFWSSQNNHLGRADGAIRLIEELATAELPRGGRVMLWGHSHAGNVFSLLTNLLAADSATREAFFEAARVYYRWPVLGCTDIPVWQRVEKLLEREPGVLAGHPLDVVTFGTPIRYGWDSSGYARLLHFVYHRPTKDLPHHLAPFPPSVERVLAAADGDYVQQVGIAGTNVMPSVFSWRSWLADVRLNALLQKDIQARNLLDYLRAGRRVADEGTTLLVDYGPPTGGIAEHVAGHAVYTRSQWLLFHAEEVARRFYHAAGAESAA